MKHFGFNGTVQTLSVTTLSGVVTEYLTVIEYNCSLMDKNGTVLEFKAYGLECITGSISKVPAAKLRKLFPGVSRQKLKSVERGSKVDFLIGLPHPSWHPTPTIRASGGGDFWLFESRLGSCVGGRHPEVREGTRRSNDLFTVDVKHTYFSEVSASLSSHELEFCPSRTSSYEESRNRILSSQHVELPTCELAPSAVVDVIEIPKPGNDVHVVEGDTISECVETSDACEEVEMQPSAIAMNIDVDMLRTVSEEVDDQSSHLVMNTLINESDILQPDVVEVDAQPSHVISQPSELETVFEDVVLSLPADANMSELDTRSADVDVSANLVLSESHATAQSSVEVHSTESSDHLVERVLNPKAHEWNPGELWLPASEETIQHATCAAALTCPMTEDRFFQLEALGTTVNPKCGGCKCGKCPVPGSLYSFKEQTEYDKILTNLVYQADLKRWFTKLPWKSDRSALPRNDKAALKMLHDLERSLLKKPPELAMEYNYQIRDMVERGVAVLLTEEVRKRWDKDYYYLHIVGV